VSDTRRDAPLDELLQQLLGASSGQLWNRHDDDSIGAKSVRHYGPGHSSP